MPKGSEVTSDAMFKELFQYHRDLVSRQWQYFATFLVVQGLLLNTKQAFENFKGTDPALLSISAILMGGVFLRWIGRIRRRTRLVAIWVNELAGEPLLEVYKKGAIGVKGITLWLYATILVFTLPWFGFLRYESQVGFGVMVILFTINLITVGLVHK
jgi:hypothetical protein